MVFPKKVRIENKNAVINCLKDSILNSQPRHLLVYDVIFVVILVKNYQNNLNIFSMFL